MVSFACSTKQTRKKIKQTTQKKKLSKATGSDRGRRKAQRKQNNKGVTVNWKIKMYGNLSSCYYQ